MPYAVFDSLIPFDDFGRLLDDVTPEYSIVDDPTAILIWTTAHDTDVQVITTISTHNGSTTFSVRKTEEETITTVSQR